MKRITLFFLIILLIAGTQTFAQDMTLDEILEAHFEAIGQKKISKAKTIMINGKAMQMGMDGVDPYFGMTFAMGVEQAIRWLTDDDVAKLK